MGVVVVGVVVVVMVVMIVMSNVVMMMLMAIDGDSHNVTHEHSDGDFDGHHGDDVDGRMKCYRFCQG